MAAPIIDSISAQPATVNPGQMFVVSITAHDPDATTGRLVGVVEDKAGHASQATVLLTISDPLSFSLTDPDNAGFVITPRVGQPGVFDCKAPGA